MESAATYLRFVEIKLWDKGLLSHRLFTDTSYVVEALRLIRSGQNNEAALNFLEKSTAQIDALVCSFDLINIKH